MQSILGVSQSVCAIPTGGSKHTEWTVYYFTSPSTDATFSFQSSIGVPFRFRWLAR